MLKINFTAETANDHITPLTISHAIADHLTSDADYFENSLSLINEVANHLESFVRSQRNILYREERKLELERYEQQMKGQVETNG